MRIKNFLQAGVIFLFFYSVHAFAQIQTVFLDYYNSGVPSKPIIISNATPDHAYIFGMQGRVTSLGNYFTLDSGFTVMHFDAGSQSTWGGAIFPMLRFWLYQDGFARPFAEMSIGPAYLDQNNMNGANLGGHFVFQNEFGLGLNVGQEHIFNFMLKYYHYGNYGLFSPNAGFDVPFVFSVGYQF